MLSAAAGLVCVPGRVLAEGLAGPAVLDLALEAQEMLASGNVDGAVANLERALALGPGSSVADQLWMRGLLARGYMVQGRSNLALREVEAILAARPDEPTALFMREQLRTLASAEDKTVATATSNVLLRRVVLDPGHGGFDPGAVHNGLQEKDVVLDIARRTARMAERMAPGLKVRLTRSDDYFVPLDARAVTANWFEADLFVSLHANAHGNEAAKGLETYRCAERPTSAQAAKVAARENSAPQGEEKRGGQAFVDLEDILFRFERAQAWQAGEQAAQRMQKGLTQTLPLRDRGVHGANFAVLRKARMPAMLVEAGFLSNPQEAEMLASPEGRERVAQALATEISRLAREGVA